MCVCTRCKGSTLQGMIYLFVSFVCSTVNCRQSSVVNWYVLLRFAFCSFGRYVHVCHSSFFSFCFMHTRTFTAHPLLMLQPPWTHLDPHLHPHQMYNKKLEIYPPFPFLWHSRFRTKFWCKVFFDHHFFGIHEMD